MHAESWQRRVHAAIVGCTVLLSACSFLPRGDADLDTHKRALGWASWYGDGFHGRLTASGEAFIMYEFTAAHRTLPFDTIVQVTNFENGKQVLVRINDRGPYVPGRILDLSYAAAQALEMLDRGVSIVSLAIIRPETDPHQDGRGLRPQEFADSGTSERGLFPGSPEVRYLLRPLEDIWFERRPRYQLIVAEAEWPM